MDFFTPICDDPFVQGRIAIANVLSDLYSVGVHQIDSILMVLCVPTAWSDEERRITVGEMIAGFNAGADEANVKVDGGQTIFNPWPIIGGSAAALVPDIEIIHTNLQPGDTLVLTKPLGTQLIANLRQWVHKASIGDECSTEFLRIVNEAGITVEDIREAGERSEQTMMRLNKNASELMFKHKAHGATDITGFGIFGHARNMAIESFDAGHPAVCCQLDMFPVLPTTALVDTLFTWFRLSTGLSAETSGGLLIAFKPEDAIAYVAEMNANGNEAWIVGSVRVAEAPSAEISSDLNLLTV